MKFSIPKIVATTVVVLSGVIWEITPSYAASMSYTLSFFDNSGEKIGSGWFSYDTSSSTCIQTLPFGDSCDPFELRNGFFVKTELTDFSANISGTEWTLNDRSGQLWWDDENENELGAVREAIASRSGIFTRNQWFFGDQFFNQYFLSIRGQSGGSWTQGLDYSDYKYGTWTASVVPEPLTILGVATAIGFGTFFKLKLNRSSTKLGDGDVGE
ncbi:MAG: PEP-CTERM sorting domain-containing protein [Crocosphaera sp.]